jgi:endonuclease/exonuclease/phosphatase family metal-dependent hydrolase
MVVPEGLTRRRGAALAVLFAGATAACGGAGYDAPEPAPAAAACRATTPLVAEPVRWLVTAADRTTLDAWCAAVGPALVATVPQPTPAAVVDSLLVVSWNVHVGGGDLSRFIEDVRSGRLTDGVPVRHFALLVQETFREAPHAPAPGTALPAPRSLEVTPPTGRRVGIEDVARRHGLSLIYAPSMRNGLREDRGNAILATLPLTAPLALELPVERQRRVVVAGMVHGRTTVGAPWTLQLASVHLENRSGRRLLGVAGRRRQAAWLLDALPPAPLAVLGGDLNTWTRGAAEPAARLVAADYPQTPAELPAGSTYAHLLLRGRLDYLFARVPGGAMTTYRRAATAYGSDHYPLLAWIRIPASGSPGLSAP